MAVDRASHVLVVDDFPFMRELMINYLKNLGFSVIFEAQNGEEALKVLEKEKIDLVLSDWLMPKMNGLELLKKVRTVPEMKKLPFLLVTTEGSRDNIMEAIKCGVSGYLIKPFDQEVLDEKIEKAFVTAAK